MGGRLLLAPAGVSCLPHYVRHSLTVISRSTSSEPEEAEEAQEEAEPEQEEA